MKLVKITENQAEIQFAYRELCGLNGALNEDSNGIYIPNFESKIGKEKEKVRPLLKAIRFDIINQMESGMMFKMVFIKAREIRKELNFKCTQIIIPPALPQIRQECYLGIGSDLFVFLLCSFQKTNVFCGNQILKIDLKETLQILAKTPGQHLDTSTFFDIVAYLELCVELEKNKATREPYKISPYNRQRQQLFCLQVLSGHLTAGGYLQLRLHLQTKFQKEQKNPETDYLEVEGAASFEDILKFTASIREFMTKLTERSIAIFKPTPKLHCEYLTDDGYYPPI